MHISFIKLNQSFSLGMLLLCLSAPAFSEKIQVVAITEDFASITKEIGKDKVITSSLIKGSRDLHHITPKPSMVLKLKKANLLIRLGMEQDSWIDSLIQVAKNPKLFPGKSGYLDCSENITKLEVPTFKIDASKGHVHKHGNPHYWLDPNNGKVIARDIYHKLSKIDPINKPYYKKNFDTFLQSLNAKIKLWESELEELKETNFITYHKVWIYFFNAFQLKSIGELESLPGIPPTVNHLKSLKRKSDGIHSNKIVISAKFYSKRIGDNFSKKIQAEHKQVPTNVENPKIPSYIALFDTIVKEIKK